MPTLKDLIAQRARLNAAFEQSPKQIQDLEARKSELEGNMDAAIRASLRTGDQALEDDVRRRLAEVDSAIDSARRRRKISMIELQKIDQEITAAEVAERRVLNDKAAALAAPIEASIASDRRMRASLIEAAGLYLCAAGSEARYFSWELFISNVFSEIKWPTDVELAASISAARKTLGVTP